MLKLFKRIFHRHNWVYDSQDYVGDGYYNCVSHCSICNKRRSQMINIHGSSL